MKHKISVELIALLGLSLIGIDLVARFYMRPPIHLRQIAILVLYAILHFWLLGRSRNSRPSLARAIASCAVGFGWLYSTHTRALSTMSHQGYILFVMTGLVLSFTCYLIITELQRPFPTPTPSRRGVTAAWLVAYGIIPIVGWLPYLLAYYPAKMNADSFWQWAQAHHITQYNNWHPVLDTWIIQACSLIYNSPASYIVLQIVIMAVVIAYALHLLRGLGAPRWLLLVLDGFYAVNPAIGILAITMWKDILFASLVFLLTTMFAKIGQQESWLRQPRHTVAFALVCFLVMCTRQNGPETVAAALVLLIFLVKSIRARLMVVAAAVFVLFALYTGPLLDSLHVIPNRLNEALAIPSQQIAATYKDKGKFTPQVKAYFDSILPAANWEKDYNPYTVNPIKWDKQYNAGVIDSDFGEYLSNWAQLLRLNPGTFIRAYFKQTAEIWQFVTPANMHLYLDTPVNLQNYPLYVRIRAKNDTTSPSVMERQSYETYVDTLKSFSPGSPVPTYAQFQDRVKRTLAPLYTNSRFAHLRTQVNKVFNHTRFTWANYFIKGAIPFFLLIVSLIAAVERFKRKGLIPFLPTLFVIITLAISMPAIDFRYQFGYAFAVPFLLVHAKRHSE